VATPHGLVDTFQCFRGTACRQHVDRWSTDPDNGGIRRLAESWVLLVRSAKFLGMQGPILKLRVLFHIVLAITVELCKIAGEIILFCCMTSAKKCVVVEVIFVIAFIREDVESDLSCLPLRWAYHLSGVIEKVTVVLLYFTVEICNRIFLLHSIYYWAFFL
jgi:hypothetical protein